MKKLLIAVLIALSAPASALMNYENDMQLLPEAAWRAFPSYAVDWIVDNPWQEQYEDYLRYFDFDRWDAKPAYHLYMVNFSYVFFDPTDPNMPYFDDCGPTVTPTPPSLILFGTGLLSLGVLRRKTKRGD